MCRSRRIRLITFQYLSMWIRQHRAAEAVHQQGFCTQIVTAASQCKSKAGVVLFCSLFLDFSQFWPRNTKFNFLLFHSHFFFSISFPFMVSCFFLLLIASFQINEPVCGPDPDCLCSATSELLNVTAIFKKKKPKLMTAKKLTSLSFVSLVTLFIQLFSRYCFQIAT